MKAAARGADTVIAGARVYAVPETLPWSDGGPTAIAIRDGRIVGVGSDDEIEAWIGGATDVRRLNGHVVTPGLFDSHNHMLKTALGTRLPSLGRVTDIAELLDVVASAHQVAGASRWIECSPAWHESSLAESRMPTIDELDAVVPDAPVFLRRGGHNAVLNTRAFERFGMLDTRSNPPGATIVRDSSGRPTGHIIGAPFINGLVRQMPAMSAESKAEALRDIGREYLELGITSVVEPGLTPADIALLQRMHETGDLPLRTHAMWRLAYQDERIGDVVSSIEARELVPHRGTHFSLFGIKLSVDGGTETGYYREPYLRPDDELSPYGKPLLARDDLVAIGLAAARHGWHVGVHCVGDAAIDLVLEAFDRIDRAAPLRGRRWSLIHMMNPRDEHWAEVRRLGLTVTAQQPLVAALGEGFLHYLGEERAANIVPLARILQECPLPVGGGSDSPVAPFDPWAGIASSINRRIASGRALGPHHAITSLAALQMYTTGSAYCAFQEGHVGQLRPGMFADLLVLEPDAFRHPDAIPSGPLATMIDGKVVHDVL